MRWYEQGHEERGNLKRQTGASCNHTKIVSALKLAREHHLIIFLKKKKDFMSTEEKNTGHKSTVDLQLFEILIDWLH